MGLVCLTESSNESVCVSVFIQCSMMHFRVLIAGWNCSTVRLGNTGSLGHSSTRQLGALPPTMGPFSAPHLDDSDQVVDRPMTTTFFDARLLFMMNAEVLRQAELRIAKPSISAVAPTLAYPKTSLQSRDFTLFDETSRCRVRGSNHAHVRAPRGNHCALRS